jgi:hypothetical protein
LQIPAISASSERFFSKGANIVSKNINSNIYFIYIF